jgi:hypothetical protein
MWVWLKFENELFGPADSDARCGDDGYPEKQRSCAAGTRGNTVDMVVKRVGRARTDGRRLG